MNTDERMKHAFPHFHYRSDGVIELKGGLSKREYFAGLAMQGFCATMAYKTPGQVAELSAQYADALLAELAKEAP